MAVAEGARGETLALEDQALVEQIRRGNTDAFEELYDRFQARALRVARAVCRDDGRAEEAVQEAFLAVWRSAASYHSERGSVAGWLLSLVRYRAIDVSRSNIRHARKRADEARLALRATPGATADEMADRADATHLKLLLQRLPDAQQEVITLAFYGQLSHTEIAKLLDLPPGTVKGRMRLGLQKLRLDIDLLSASARWHLALTAAFRVGDLEQARRVVREASDGMPVVSMLDDVLAPAMHDVGDRWQGHDVKDADHDLAGAVCERLITEIAPELLIAPPRTRETVLLLAPAPERHTLGLQMAAGVLDGAGYNTVLLGGGIADTTLGRALSTHRPDLIALTSTMPPRRSLATTTGLIRETLPDAHLIIGGAAAERLPPNVNAHHVPRLDGLLETVDELLGASGS
jgi:RNA polymerase sigma-70 factor (ECF subfamily)